MNKFILIGAVTALGLILVVAVAIQGGRYDEVYFPDEEPDVPDEPEDPSEPIEYVTTLQMWARDDIKDAFLTGQVVLEVCRVGNGGTTNITLSPVWIQTDGESILDVSVYAEKTLLLPDESSLVYMSVNVNNGDSGVYRGYVDLQPTASTDDIGGNSVVPGGTVPNIKMTVIE